MRMKTFIAAGSIALVAVTTAGCQSSGPNQTGGALLGAIAGGAVGSAFGHGAGKVGAVLAGAAIGGLLGGAIGQQLDDASRQRAYEAQYNAVAYGRRVDWQGNNGAYGYVEPGPPVAGPGGYCREYTQTIYIGGRPQRGYGQACQQPDGSWQIVS